MSTLTNVPGPTTIIAPPLPIPPDEELTAPSVMLLGESGTGKTDVLGELPLLVEKLFVIVTEPNGLESLLDSIDRRKADLNKVHYHVIGPARANFQELEQLARKVSVSNHETLSKQLPGNRYGAKMIDCMGVFHNFVCHRTKQSFGSLDKLGPFNAVAVDSLSGLTSMAWDVTVGDKLTAHPGEWGIGQNLIDKALLSWTSNLKCLFVLTGHLERETDEISQGTKLMASTLGKKLAPKLPRFFSEVVMASTENGQFYWHTAYPGVALKRRALPLGNKLDPSFRPIIERYKQRLEILSKKA